MANALNPNDGYANYSDDQLAQLPGAPKRGANGGYIYGWRPEAYQDVLGDNDVSAQQQLTTFRQQAGGKVAEDDAGALAQMQGKTSTAPQYQTAAQQWNAQPAPTGAPQGGDIFSLLMQRIQQPATPDPNDPVIRGQADAYSANTERSKRNYLADLAESAGPYANLRGETRMANERAGQANAGFEADLIGREQAARRQDIQQELQLYGSLMTADRQQALQRELAYLDNASQASGRALQNTQFEKDLALRETNQNNLWDFNWQTLGL